MGCEKLFFRGTPPLIICSGSSRWRDTLADVLQMTNHLTLLGRSGLGAFQPLSLSLSLLSTSQILCMIKTSFKGFMSLPRCFILSLCCFRSVLQCVRCHYKVISSYRAFWRASNPLLQAAPSQQAEKKRKKRDFLSFCNPAMLFWFLPLSAAFKGTVQRVRGGLIGYQKVSGC